MNLTLYLTENCNLRCSYCVREKCPNDMTEETLRKSLDLAFSRGERAGLCFFGGEPLLRKDLIKQGLSIGHKKSVENRMPFSTKITTNGTLLDEEILRIFKDAGTEVGFSFDGLMQDDSRRTPEGGKTFDLMVGKAELLLRYLPNSTAMCTVNPKSVGKLFDTVKFFHDTGFKKVICNPAYGHKVEWTDEDLDVLKKQYALISDYLFDLFSKGDRFRLAPLHNKIAELISGIDPGRFCHLGLRQLAVAYNGYLYPCTSFLYKEDYCLGSVFDGIDEDKRVALSKRCFVPEPCRECDLRTRCTNSCGCSNILNTGSPDMISPLQCEYERLLIGTADELGDRLFEADKDRFLKMFKKY